MTIFSWNCRGLGHQSVVPALKNLIQLHKPEIIFLFETLVNANKIEEVRRSIGSVDDTEFGATISFCKVLLLSRLQNSHVEFSRMLVNMVAQSLARVATNHANPHCFFDIPTCIASLIMNEMH